MARRPKSTLLRSVMAVTVLAAMASVAVLGPGAGLPASAAPQPYNGPCPGGTSQCVQAQLPCNGQASTCPTVVAGPTQGLSTNQYVYLSLSNYPPTDTVRVAFCATDGVGTIVSVPYCATTTSGGVTLNKRFVSVGTDGTANATTPVAYDPPGQDNPPLPAVPLVQNGQPPGSFFCDNGPDYCSVVVTDDGPGAGAGPSDTAANTVIIPLNFSPGPSACPAGDPQLFTDSSFSAEQLIPAMVQASCAAKNGVVAINTATNTQAEVGDLASGGTPVAFTDNPWDPQVTKVLTGGSASFAYIPVALSATVMAFRGGVPDQTQAGVVFPVASYNLTPNMVAGALTTSYEAIGSVDNLLTAPTKKDTPPIICAQVVGCNKKTAFNYNTFFLLNPEPAGVGQPGSIGSFFSNTFAGTNYQLSQWLCAAPNAPFQVSLHLVGSPGPQQVSVTDTYNTATGTLTTPPTSSPFWNTQTSPSLWPFKTCAPTSQFPTLSPGSLNGYGPADTPGLQAKAIRLYGGGGQIAFGAMDWSEATFNGLNVAALQNASGHFIVPSASSVIAGLTDATAAANGTLTFNYHDTANTTAYPMPMVTYAVVPTKALPASSAHALSNFLTNLVNFSAGKSGVLPGGYVPLPPTLTAQAMQDISKDIVSLPSANSGGAPPTHQASSPVPATAPFSPPLSTPHSASPGLGTPSTPAGLAGPVSPSAARAPTAATRPPSGPGRIRTVLGATFEVLVGGTRGLLPILIGLAIALVVVGPVLLAWPRRRRPVGDAGPATAPEGGEP